MSIRPWGGVTVVSLEHAVAAPLYMPAGEEAKSQLTKSLQLQMRAE